MSPFLLPAINLVAPDSSLTNSEYTRRSGKGTKALKIGEISSYMGLGKKNSGALASPDGKVIVTSLSAPDHIR